MNSTAKSSHLGRIDVLRAVAILLVVCLHFLPSVTGQYEFNWAGMWRNVHDVQTSWMWFLSPFTLGWSGVSLFFVISGFCIHYSFLKHEASGGGPFLKSFFWKRFWRIYPAYFLALVVFYYLDSRHPATSIWANHFWSHALLLHNFDADAIYDINGSFWSLAVEAQFYVLFPLVLYLRQRIGMKGTFWLFAFVSLVCRFVAFFIQDWSQPVNPCLWFFPLTLYTDWLLGAWLVEKWLAGQRLMHATPPMAVALGILAVAATSNKITVTAFGFTACSVFFAAVTELYLFSAKPFGRLEKLLVPVGLCSYSIYLWHQPLIGRLMHLLHKLGLSSSPSANLAALPVVVAALIAIGFMSYKVIELPGISLGKFFWGKRG
jgi:peptidoglycan/LPS O-acetylase OafA/YrhL